MPLNGSRESGVDLGFRSGRQYFELQTLDVCCLLRRGNDASYLRPRPVRVQE